MMVNTIYWFGGETRVKTQWTQDGDPFEPYDEKAPYSENTGYMDASAAILERV